MYKLTVIIYIHGYEGNCHVATQNYMFLSWAGAQVGSNGGGVVVQGGGFRGGGFRGKVNL